MKPGSDMSCGFASSVTARLPPLSASRTRRRVRSASAANTASSASSSYLTTRFSIRLVAARVKRRVRASPARRGPRSLNYGVMGSPALIACHECDLLQRRAAVPPGGRAVCDRCGAALYAHHPDTIDRTLALILAAALLFVIGNVFPVVSMEIQGQRTDALVLVGAWRLHQEGESLVGALVFLTAFVFPLVQIVGMLAILVPLRLGLTPRYLVPVFRSVEQAKPWSMVEVFMLGVLVSLVKLAHLATVIPGIGMWAFFALIIVLAWASSTLDAHQVWARLEKAEAAAA